LTMGQELRKRGLVIKGVGGPKGATRRTKSIKGAKSAAAPHTDRVNKGPRARQRTGRTAGGKTPEPQNT